MPTVVLTIFAGQGTGQTDWWTNRQSSKYKLYFPIWQE